MTAFLLLFYSTLLFADPIDLKGQQMRELLVKAAYEFRGIPYNFGSNTIARGLDCSAFVQKIYGFYGIKLPRTAAEQSSLGMDVDSSALRAADLVFFANTGDRSGITHVAIATGKGTQFVHAASKGIGVATLENNYWKWYYAGARRILGDNEKVIAAQAVARPSVPPTSFDQLISAQAAFQDTMYAKWREIEQKTTTKPTTEASVSLPPIAPPTPPEPVVDLTPFKTGELAISCPVLFSKPVAAYIYDPTYKLFPDLKPLRFTQKVLVVGSSADLAIGPDRKIKTKVCVQTDEQQRGYINAEALSFERPLALADTHCTLDQKGPEQIKTARRAGTLYARIDYENLSGRVITPLEIKVGNYQKGDKLTVTGSSGYQKLKLACVRQGNHVFTAFAGDLE